MTQIIYLIIEKPVFAAILLWPIVSIIFLIIIDTICYKKNYSCLDYNRYANVSSFVSWINYGFVWSNFFTKFWKKRFYLDLFNDNILIVNTDLLFLIYIIYAVIILIRVCVPAVVRRTDNPKYAMAFIALDALITFCIMFLYATIWYYL